MILSCIKCNQQFEFSNIYQCTCGGSLEVKHDLNNLNISQKTFATRLQNNPWSSGVWRYKELIIPGALNPITRNEGNTRLYNSDKIDKYIGGSITLKHEGENPTGSFKDRGMTAAITAANLLGVKKVICASTGNTSASMASYASQAGLKAIVLIPNGKIAYGKLAQSLAYGAKTISIHGNFDKAMQTVRSLSNEYYVMNSLNPFRIEGQKSLVFELLQQLNWNPPDWIILPGGNLGNNTALSKGLMELLELDIINKVPKIAVIQAHGANPLYTMWRNNTDYAAMENPDTIATAIKIGNPVNWQKSIKGIKWTKGTVEEVTDQEIMDAKAIVDNSGIGAEPASCATVAGVKKLIENNIIKSDERVCGVLTGNFLKDPDVVINYHNNKIDVDCKFANKIIEIENIDEIEGII